MINKQAFFLDIWSLENLESTQEARAAQDVTLTLLLYSLDFPRVSITRYTLAKHEPILIEKNDYCEKSGNSLIRRRQCEQVLMRSQNRMDIDRSEIDSF